MREGLLQVRLALGNLAEHVRVELSLHHILTRRTRGDDVTTYSIHIIITLLLIVYIYHYNGSVSSADQRTYMYITVCRSVYVYIHVHVYMYMHGQKMRQSPFNDNLTAGYCTTCDCMENILY